MHVGEVSCGQYPAVRPERQRDYRTSGFGQGGDGFGMLRIADVPQPYLVAVGRGASDVRAGDTTRGQDVAYRTERCDRRCRGRSGEGGQFSGPLRISDVPQRHLVVDRWCEGVRADGAGNTGGGQGMTIRTECQASDLSA